MLKLSPYNPEFKKEIKDLFINGFSESYYTTSLAGDLRESYLLKKIIYPLLGANPKSGYLSYEKNILTGIVIFLTTCDYSGYYQRLSNGKKSGVLLYICVKGNFQKKGIGTILIKKVLNHFQNCGIDNIFLTVEKSNIKASALYKKFGFIAQKKFIVLQSEKKFFSKEEKLVDKVLDYKYSLEKRNNKHILIIKEQNYNLKGIYKILNQQKYDIAELHIPADENKIITDLYKNNFKFITENQVCSLNKISQ